MSEEKKGIESLKKLSHLIIKNIKLGVEIGKDGLNKEDIIFVKEISENVKEIVLFMQSSPDIISEFKDIDLLEGFELGQEIYQEVKK